jgi:hypothetical protein
MSIEKKSLISTLKTTKKANVASAPLAEVSGATHGVKMAKAARMSKAARMTKAAKLAKMTKFARLAKFVKLA